MHELTLSDGVATDTFVLEDLCKALAPGQFVALERRADIGVFEVGAVRPELQLISAPLVPEVILRERE